MKDHMKKERKCKGQRNININRAHQLEQDNINVQVLRKLQTRCTPQSWGEEGLSQDGATITVGLRTPIYHQPASAQV